MSRKSPSGYTPARATKHTIGELAKLLERQGGGCDICCESMTKDTLKSSYIIDPSSGGNAFIGNIRLLCDKCQDRWLKRAPYKFNDVIPCGTKEDDHMIALFSWIRSKENPFKEAHRMFHVPNGGKRGIREGARFKKMGVSAGVPDLHLPVPRRGFTGLYIELKVGTNKPEEAQYEWLQHLHNEGAKAVWCTGWQSARETLVWYLSQAD